MSRLRPQDVAASVTACRAERVDPRARKPARLVIAPGRDEFGFALTKFFVNHATRAGFAVTKLFWSFSPPY